MAICYITVVLCKIFDARNIGLYVTIYVSYFRYRQATNPVFFFVKDDRTGSFYLYTPRQTIDRRH